MMDKIKIRFVTEAHIYINGVKEFPLGGYDNETFIDFLLLAQPESDLGALVDILKDRHLKYVHKMGFAYPSKTIVHRLINIVRKD